MPPPHVFTIPPGVAFLDQLVAGLLDGRLIEGFDARSPFALADTTLYLPTRRAARAIRERFLVRLGRPLLLPKIRTLGDIDEDDPEFLIQGGEPAPAAVSAMERQLVLTRLVLGWSGALARQVAELPDEELIVPASPADAARLAASLGSLLDQVGTDAEAWRGLAGDMSDDLTRYWSITLEFLKVVTEHWPKHLAERGLIDPGTHRDLAIRAEAARLLQHGSAAPVIAAGSTGSVPATAALLAAIAQLPNGAVVLPGLDQDLDAETFDAIGVDASEPAGAGHPQYGLKLLLDTLGVTRDDVRPLLDAPTSAALRNRFVSEAMRPASTTERWTEAPVLTDMEKHTALEHVALVETANERDEALAVAVLLRETVETPGSVAALITPDRGLARRVAVELKRWKIDVDDSGGRPLGRTPPGVFARLVAEVGLLGGPAETLLALLKHPLAAFGLDPFEARRAARALERAILRGPRLRPGIAILRHALDQALAEKLAKADADENATGRTAARRLPRAAWDGARDLAVRLETGLSPLEALAARGGLLPLAELVEAHFTSLLAAAGLPSGETTSIFADEAGAALASTFEELRRNAASGPDIAAGDYPGLFSALIERSSVRRRAGVDPRIHIWGALEARLQSVDRVILGGLNEGTWPGQTRRDPLLSRPMRAALSLEPPERRIGLAAHDFTQALGHRQVFLTRADREDGEPRVASRWLQRLLAYAGEAESTAMRRRGAAVIAAARSLDHTDVTDLPKRPRPSPPVALRPKQLSVTRIETLIRDPYDVYARSVLRLRPFEAIGKMPDASERGMLIHGVLEAFVQARPNGPYDATAEAELLALGREAFEAYRDFPEVMAVWWPRFEKIARWFVREEALSTDVVARNVEAVGKMQVTPEFLLTSRADRLDRLASGGLQIVDYKTGTPPSAKEVASLAPQLPLEGLIARQGGFEGLAAAEPERIVYYRLTGRGEGGEPHDRSEVKRDGRTIDVADMLAATERRLNELVAHFATPEADYPSNKIPKPRRTFVGDYDHLARIAEWVATDQEEDDGEPRVG